MKYKYIKLNTKKAKEIEQKLKNNGGYCPCCMIKNEDTKCMCKAFREINYEGICYCGLYEKIKVDE